MNKAVRRANDLRHEYLTLEGVFLALLDDEEVVSILDSCGAKVTELQTELVEFLENPKNFSILNDNQIEKLSQHQFADEEMRNLARMNGIFYQPEISLSLQRVIQRAAFQVQSSGKKQIRAVNLLVAMYNEKESFAIYLLEKQGVARLNIVDAVAHGVDRPLNALDNEGGSELTESGEGEAEVGEGNPRPLGPGKPRKSLLEEFSVNLNAQVKAGLIDPLIGRELEIERMIQILCRRRKNNPMLVGDAGVGKTALAEGLAFRIEEGAIPDLLKTAKIWTLDIAALLAGAKFRGDFEQRLRGVLKELVELRKKGEDVILFVDEIHTVMGAGATGGGSLDASNLLKPYLSSGQIRCIGSTTHEEYRRFIEKDSAFSRRFQKLDVDEPSVDDSYKILLGLRSKFEEYHGVHYSNKVMKSAVDLAEKYLTDRRLPDKAIDLIDEAGAMVRLRKKTPDAKANVTTKDIELVVSKLAKVPERSVVGDEKLKLRNLKDNLKLLIFGQDEAIDKVNDSILMSRSGLGNEGKPLASFVFAGPTGVGKTELARQLAFQMGINFERFDMSEYMEKHAVAKLIGAPPGYIGHENGGVLTDAIKKSPYTVLLLDEIEKAHPDIFNILLQVMDHGRLTDSLGRTTNFKNTILIMTTNAGAKEMEAGAIGLGGGKSTQDNSSKREQALKSFFSPEFRNRLDGIVFFSKLAPTDILNVVDKFLAQVEQRLAAKGVNLVVDLDARQYIAKNGFDEKLGARPIERFINDKISRPLSKELLFGQLEKGGAVEISLKEGNLAFQFRPRGVWPAS